MKNIILIMTDSQGVNLLGKSGQNKARTPYIDALAAKGENYTNAFTTCPLCTPARAGIFTGLYPHTSGAWANSMPLGENVRNMGEYFSDAGYETAFIGKWHLDGWDYFGTGGAFKGWSGEYWYDGKNYLHDLGVEESRHRKNGLKTLDDLREHKITREFTWAGKVTDRALDFIKKEHNKPYLMVVSYDEPHEPSVCPPEFLEMYTDDVNHASNAEDNPALKPVHHNEWAKHFNKKDMEDQRLYKACATFTDSEIGRVIDAAREDTLIIFTSDHGHYMGAHSLDGKGPAMYNEVLRIPLIFWETGVYCGGINKKIVSHIDILPTIMDYAGLSIPPVLPGISLLKGERGVAFSEFNRMSMYHDGFFGFTPIRSVITEKYKLVINLFQTDELYDLENDPGEINNLIYEDNYCGEREELLGLILEWQNQTCDPMRGRCWETRHWRKEVPENFYFYGNRRWRKNDNTEKVWYNYTSCMPEEE